MKEQDHHDDSPGESIEREPEIDLSENILDVANALDAGWDTILPDEADEDEADDLSPSEEDSE